MTIPVYLEIGSKRTFACALDWPGWSRSGRDESSALEALLNYGLRYKAVARLARVQFQAPGEASEFHIVQRVKGDATTDFGTPGRIPSSDFDPVDEAELTRLQSLLKGCWRTFDEVIETAKGRALKFGPRGGGRDRQKMIEHVIGGQQAYLSRLGVKLKLTEGAPWERQMAECREAVLKGVISAARGELTARGPRGALHWPLRYFVRRSAWHVLDHSWELEDRLVYA